MDDFIEVPCGRFRWVLRPELRDLLLGPDGLRLDDWVQGGQAQLVKQGPHRTVWHVVLPGLDFHLKHNRLMNVRAWLRELVRPAKASIEFATARAIAARGVPTIEPLAIGEQPGRPGESYLITRSLVGAVPLQNYVEATLPALPLSQAARRRIDLGRSLGQFVAGVHAAGILHEDLHPGNILIRPEEAGQFALFLVDLHAVRLGPPLRQAAREANLVLFNRWFSLRASRSERRRFWQAYSAAAGLPAADETIHRLEQDTLISNLRFWKHRDARCLVTNRYYRRFRQGELAGAAICSLDRATLEPLLADPDEPFRRAGTVLLKDSPNSTVATVELAGQSVIYKRFPVKSWTDPWAALVRRSPAWRSWIHGHGFLERDLPTARPLAVFERRCLGMVRETYLVTEKIPGAVDLHGHLANLGQRGPLDHARSLRRLIDELARLVRTLHDRRLSHRDLKANNILVQSGGGQVECETEDPVLWLIDLVGVVRHGRLPRSRKVQNLARLHASFCQSADLTRTDKLRFLRIYLRWGLEGRAGWKRWWHQVESATQAKVVRNLRNGRALT